MIKSKRRMLRLVFHQYKFDLLAFWRDPAAMFFTAILPLIFLVLFVSIFGNDVVQVRGQSLRGASYLIPGIATLAVVSATTLNLAISLTALRERGVLKRLRSTPLPPWVFVLSRVLVSITVMAVIVTLIAIIGQVFYNVPLPARSLPAGLLALVVGTAALSCLGIALTSIIPSEEAAPAICNAIVLPLYFISGIFIADESIPSFLKNLAKLFPVKHLFNALFDAFTAPDSAQLATSDVVVMLAWGVFGVVVAAATFRWTPRQSN